mgnify:CR=1 FL=1
MRLRKPGIFQARSSAGLRMPTIAQPVVAVGCEVDVVGIARQVVDDSLDVARLRAIEPIALDRAAEGLGEQDRFAVAGDADAVGKFQSAQHGARRARCCGS